MMLCLDIGNTRTKAAVFADETIVTRFEGPSEPLKTAEGLKRFLAEQLAAQALSPMNIEAVSICQVLGNLDAVIQDACRSLFDQPPFLLNGLTLLSLSLHYLRPKQLGPDRIAAAIGAAARWPDENLIVIDCGTAITFCCVDRHRAHLGGVITAGPGLMARALGSGTGRLPSVSLNPQVPIVGRCTESGIQSGLFFGTLGLIREITERLRTECFAAEPVRVVATGGDAAIFAPYEIFGAVDPDLVLYGLMKAHPMNSQNTLRAGPLP